MAKLGSSAIVPPDLRDPLIQIWLDDDEASQRLIAAARARLDSRPDATLESGLKQSLLIYSGYHSDLVDDRVERILQILVAGCSSALTLGGAQLASKISQEAQLTREVIRDRDAKFTRLLGATEILSHTLGKQVLEKLERIKRLRRLDSNAALLKLDKLRRDIEEGELEAASPTAKGQVYFWMARLGTTDPARTGDLRSFLERALPHISASDKRVAEALILGAEGDTNQAISHLDGVESADARATLFSLLVKYRSDDVALDWAEEEVDFSHHASLTALGWSNVAVTLFRLKRWKEAVRILTTALPLAEEWPDLHFMLGVAYGAQLLPIEFRHLALELNLFHSEIRPLEGDEANAKRELAVASFEKAGTSFARDSDPRHSAVELWLLWLRLTSPIADTQNAARSELAEIAKEDKNAIKHLQLLLAFDITFDKESVLAHLQRRRRVSTLSTTELYAEVRLKELLLDPSDFVAYLEEIETALSRDFPLVFHTTLRIQAAVRASQYNEARRLLNAADLLSAADRERFAVLIDKQQGKDPGDTLLKLYERDKDLLDLRNLVDHLTHTGQWNAAAPYLKELLRRERTVLNARRLVSCLAEIPSTEPTELLTTMDTVSDLVVLDLELTSVRAWALFNAGRVAECEHLVRQLCRQRRSADDIDLEINLALYTGNWEAFSRIIEDAAPAFSVLPASTLYRLASLAAAADSEPERAMSLLRKAVNEGPSDPELLANAALLAFRLGAESRETSRWLRRARELSSVSGPITSVDLKTVIEDWMPRRTSHLREVERDWLRGNLPVHLARRSFNLPLIQVLHGIPNSNLRASDARERAVIPIVAGSKTTGGFIRGRTVMADITSIYVLHRLGLLEAALDAFTAVILPADIFVLLLNERTDVQFHQPSRLRAAEELGQLVDSGRILVTAPGTSPPSWLVKEVGVAAAESLQSAEEHGGLFVHPLPLHRVNSYGEEPANLRDYGEYLISVLELVEMLFAAGLIDAVTHERAAAYLEAQGERLGESPRGFSPSTPIVLDELALAYLQSSGTLTAIAASQVPLRVHEEITRERAALRATSQKGTELVSSINKIRLLLREAIHAGKARLMPRQASWARDRGAYDLVASTLMDILSSNQLSDVVLIDDRFSNKVAMVAQGGDVTPVVSSVELLEQIFDTEPRKRYLCYQQLRAFGYAFIPIAAEEIRFWLSKHILGSSKILPQAEFRTMRQSLANVRALDLFEVEIDGGFLNQLQAAAVSTMRELWSDEELSQERVEAAAELVLLSLCPSTWHWLPANNRLLQLSALYLAMMAQPLPVRNAARRAAYAEWIERRFLGPILPANQHVVALSAEIINQAIAAAVEDLYGTDRQLVASFFVEGLAQPLQRAMLADSAVGRSLGLPVTRVIELDGESLAVADLIDSAISLLDNRRSVNRGRIKNFELQLRDERLVLVSAEGSVARDFSELLLLSKELRLRNIGLSSLMAGVSPYPLPTTLVQKAREARLSPSELEELLVSAWRGPRQFQTALVHKFQTSNARWSDLVPSGLDELEAAYGPLPQTSDHEQYLTTQLSSFNAALLKEGSAEGLRLVLEGFWRDDLRPSLYLSEWSAEEVWVALRECGPFDDPVALLGAIEALLSRPFTKDGLEFSMRAVRALCSDNFSRREDESDTYQLLSTLLKYVGDRISVLDGGPAAPSFWRSMVTCRHALRILRLLSGCRVNVTQLAQFVDEGRDADAWVVRLVDTRVAPRVHFWTSDPSRLRAEVLGRLRLVLEGVTDERYGEVVEVFRARQDEFSSKDALLSLLPGPLDAYTQGGSVRPAAPELVFPVDSASERQIEWALTVSARFVLSESQLRSLGEALRRFEVYRNPRSLEVLQQAAIVAAAHRDVDLADLIGDLVQKIADEFSGNQSFAAAGVLTIVAGSHAEEVDWHSWLSERLARLARRVPLGEPTESLGQFLESFQRTANLAYPVYARAAAVLDSVRQP